MDLLKELIQSADPIGIPLDSPDGVLEALVVFEPSPDDSLITQNFPLEIREGLLGEVSMVPLLFPIVHNAKRMLKVISAASKIALPSHSRDFDIGLLLGSEEEDTLNPPCA